MEKYSLWLRAAELLAVAAVLLLCVMKIRKKRAALYFKIYLGAAACYALFLLYDVTSVLCGILQMPVDVGDIGVLGCGAFLFSANFGQMDGLVDEKTKGSGFSRTVSLLAPVCLLALYCLLAFSSDASLPFQLSGIVPVLSGVCASYYHLKHLLLPADSLGLLSILRPGNLLALLFLLCNTLFTGAAVAGYGTVREIAGILAAGLLCALSICAVKEAKKWKTSI